MLHIILEQSKASKYSALLRMPTIWPTHEMMLFCLETLESCLY